MKIICCAYREWGLKVTQSLVDLFPDHTFILCRNPDEFSKAYNTSSPPDLVLAIGWSWIFERNVVGATWVIGVHPSDLPNYAGGSPLQNQILDGVLKTKNTLFRLAADIDGGPLLAKVPLNLDGHMTDIFDRLVYTSIVLFSDFIRAFPDHIVTLARDKNSQVKVYRRLKPDSGRLTSQDISQMSTRQLYDAIRCREAPYPNSYIEDEEGVLYIRSVEWEPK